MSLLAHTHAVPVVPHAHLPQEQCTPRQQLCYCMYHTMSYNLYGCRSMLAPAPRNDTRMHSKDVVFTVYMHTCTSCHAVFNVTQLFFSAALPGNRGKMGFGKPVETSNGNNIQSRCMQPTTTHMYIVVLLVPCRSRKQILVYKHGRYA